MLVAYVELVGDGVLLVLRGEYGRSGERFLAESCERVVRRQPRVAVEGQPGPLFHSSHH